MSIWGDPVVSGFLKGSELPDIESASPGQVLLVTRPSSDNVAAWEYIIPTYGTIDSGTLLGVNEYGELEWVEIEGIPDVSSADDGDVLMAVVSDNDAEARWVSLIPYHDYQDHGKVLTIDDSGGNLVWASPFPPYDDTDAGKVLTVNSTGEVVWEFPTV